ncbi:kinase-like protein [Panus rudis PR-1116 ss-1]|nr:kinase-like protein [Panus rudis PR-1116 ss-1]
MATATLLLSQHSSNPLEVGSSDIRNNTYVRTYQQATRARFVTGDHPTSSGDASALGGYHTPEIDQYHDHIAHLCSRANMPITKGKGKEVAHPAFVDLDEGMESEEDVPLAANASRSRVRESDLGQHPREEELGDEDAEGEEDDEAMVVEDEDLLADDESSPHSEEEFSFHLRPPEEQEVIASEIEELAAAVPQLTPDYRIIDRLGTGTFSSVYKAVDEGYHDKWYNTVWQGYHPPSSSAYFQSAPKPPSSKVFVAIKRIYVTSGPERIRNEISILQDVRSCRHVSQLITAFRHQDQVVVVMPYQRNDDFRDYYRVLPLDGIKQYLRCLFRAFRDIHTREIIHRDVKPANFLFDPVTGTGTLCDFGLACRIEKGPDTCLHTPPSRKAPHGRLKSPEEYDYDLIKQTNKELKLRNRLPSEKIGYPAGDKRPHSKANRAGTRGFRAPEVLLKCSDQSGAIDMWSAGVILLFFLTKKFPIFQAGDDVEALMEISTIIGRRRMEKTAILHSRIFTTNVPSVPTEGMEWADLVKRLNPDLYTPPEKPDTRFYPYTVQQRNTNGNHASSSRKRKRGSPQPQPQAQAPPTSSSPKSRRSSSTGSNEAAPNPSTSNQPNSDHVPSDEDEDPDPPSYAAQIDNALDLLDRLLQPESIKRITPRKALSHPFLRDPDDPHDDMFFPHPFGEGICGDLHFFDKDTDEPCVRVHARDAMRDGDGEDDGDGEGEMEVLTLAPGEGIAIGPNPCEFHRRELGYDFS